MMNLDTEKAALLHQLEQVDDLELIQAIKHMVAYGLKRDESISVEQYNRELEEAEAEIDRGEFYTQEEAIDRLSQWKQKQG